MSVASDLRAAADYLRKHGWVRGALGTDGGQRCMIGAILSVNGTCHAAHSDALDIVTGVRSVADFNDKHLEIAADIAEAEGK